MAGFNRFYAWKNEFYLFFYIPFIEKSHNQAKSAYILVQIAFLC